MSMVFIGMGLMAFIGVSILSMDVGMVLTARAQAQNAADAGALGGAISLYYDDYDDRSSGGPAVQTAINQATTQFNTYTDEQAAAWKGKVGKAQRALFIALAGTLASYNEGTTGPGHCDEPAVSLVPFLPVGVLPLVTALGRRRRNAGR